MPLPGPPKNFKTFLGTQTGEVGLGSYLIFITSGAIFIDLGLMGSIYFMHIFNTTVPSSTTKVGMDRIVQWYCAIILGVGFSQAGAIAACFVLYLLSSDALRSIRSVNDLKRSPTKSSDSKDSLGKVVSGQLRRQIRNFIVVSAVTAVVGLLIIFNCFFVMDMSSAESYNTGVYRAQSYALLELRDNGVWWFPLMPYFGMLMICLGIRISTNRSTDLGSANQEQPEQPPDSFPTGIKLVAAPGILMIGGIILALGLSSGAYHAIFFNPPEENYPEFWNYRRLQDMWGAMLAYFGILVCSIGMPRQRSLPSGISELKLLLKYVVGALLFAYPILIYSFPLFYARQDSDYLCGPSMVKSVWLTLYWMLPAGLLCLPFVMIWCNTRWMREVMMCLPLGYLLTVMWCIFSSSYYFEIIHLFMQPYVYCPVVIDPAWPIR